MLAGSSINTFAEPLDNFLRTNKREGRVPDEAEAVAIINEVAADEFSQEDLAVWLERNSTPLAVGEK